MLRCLRLACLSAVLAVAACQPSGPPHVIGTTPPTDGTKRHVSKDGDFAPSVPDADVWNVLSAKPGYSVLAGTEVVKVIYDKTDGTFYFLQSERWPIHYYFARRFLSTSAHPVGDEGVFNKMEYHRPDRRFVLGSLSHYPGDIWAFELYAGDELTIDETKPVFEALKTKVYFGDKLKYRAVPAAQEADPRTRTMFPVVETNAIFKNVQYQPLELGESYGYVRIFKPGEKIDGTKLRPFDIVVIGTLPEDIPVVSGVITDELQAPLGHINVLCHNRKTPNMALRGASALESVKALEGKLVRLSVDGQGYKLEPAEQAAAEKSWEAKRPQKWTKPERDDRDLGLPNITELRKDDTARAGAKAAQLGFVTQVSAGKFAVPKAFSLPMHGYVRFLNANGFDKRIDAMLKDATFQKDPDVRATTLAKLRADMDAAPIPADVMDPLLARIKAILPPGNVRLRSSTNAEDLPGFNGAGLYRSTRVDPNNKDDVARGLHEVWSSVWLSAAFEERNYYRIDSSSVGMAILVQQSIDDDVVNGVAITENPFNQGQPGFFINAQVSGGSVTGAHGDEVPEQILAYNYEDGRGTERLSESSKTGGKPVLEKKDVDGLVAALDALHVAFTHDSYGMSGNAVDVEFLIAGADRHVVIVQARPYHIDWTGDRKYLDADGRPVRTGGKDK